MNADAAFSTRDQDKILNHLHSMKQFSDYDLSAGFARIRVLSNCKGVSAHGSIPEKGKRHCSYAGIPMHHGLGNSEMEQFLLFLNNRIGTDTTGKGLNLDLEDKVSGRLTLNLGTISVDQNQGEAVINIRYPVTFSEQQIKDKVLSALEGSGMRWNLWILFLLSMFRKKVF